MRTSYGGSKFNHACPVNHLLDQNHNIIMGGIRSIFETEAERIENDPRLTVYLDRKLQDTTHWRSFLQIISGLQGPVYLSVDMDVFDPAVVPGVGTPQPGGFSWYQTLELIETLMANPNIHLAGADLVEMIPDPTRISEMAAAKLLLKIISLWGKAQGYDSQPETGSQMAIDYE
jgi:agmatinase